MNGDGKIDLVSIGDHGSPKVNATEGGLMIWLNNGDGTQWTLNKTGNFGYGGIALGDVNNDGFTDAGYSMHHNYSSDDFGDQLIETALGNGTAALWQPYDDGLAVNGETYGMFGIDFADINNDGLLDLGSNSFGCCNGFHVYKNNGNGTWTQTYAKNGGNSGQWLQFGDFNNDGNADIIVATQGTQLWCNNGVGGFTSMQYGLSAGYNINTDVAEVNNDGAKDIAVAKGGAKVYYFDAGKNIWQSLSSGLPESGVKGIKLADMNMDGKTDVVIWSAKNISVYTSNMEYEWSQAASFAISESVLSGMAVADFDHDGFNDIAYLAGTSTGSNKLRVYLHVRESPGLKIIPVFPKGKEHFNGGSVQFVQWLSSVPPGDSAAVKLEFSANGIRGKWKTIVQKAPNTNRYQLVLPEINSSNCYLRYTIKTAGSSKSVINLFPFSISTRLYNADGKMTADKSIYGNIRAEE